MPCSPTRSARTGLALLASTGLASTYLVACETDVSVATRSEVKSHSLDPVRDYLDPGYIPRSHPKNVELSADGGTLFVALEGNLEEPENKVLALDSGTGAVLAQIEVGRSPQGMALSPDGSLLYVANQFSNVLSVIDTASYKVVGQIPVSYYAQDLAVSPDGGTLYVANRWLDAVEVVDLTDGGSGGRVTATVPTAVNPRDIVVGPGGLLIVGSIAGTCIAAIDPVSKTEVSRLYLNSPANGIATDGTHIFVATLGRGDGHSKGPGFATDRAHGYRGDGTASTGFGDINNDIVVAGVSNGKLELLHRYTSDTAEVSTKDVPGDYDPADMIVAGALPEQAVVQDGRLYVTMSASDQVQVFAINSDASLAPVTVLDTGINPFELAVSSDGGTIFTGDRLGETVSRIAVGSNQRTGWDVGKSRDRPYPASDYERGEMFFYSAKFSSEAMPSTVFPNGTKAGDKSCNYCHRESMTDGKVWSVGINKLIPLGGERMPPSARNLADTLPLFWEGVQQFKDFDLETNEFAPVGDFGCTTDAEVNYELCTARDAFFVKQTGFTFRQVATEFLGKYLAGRPRLMPNPLAQDPSEADAAAVARGQAIFTSPEVGCFRCHPMITADRKDPFTINQNLAPVIPPSAYDLGFPFKTEVDGNVNVPSLRGLFDRPSVFFHDGRAKSLRSVFLVPGNPALVAGRDGCQHLDDDMDQFVGGVVQPVYNGLGCNAAGPDGVPTHGDTRNLTVDQVDDLVQFLRSLQ